MPTHIPSVMSWKPTPDATSFSGKPLPPDRDFFVSPPPEVGRVVAAWTDVRQGQTLWPLASKLALAGACVLVAGVVIAGTAKHTPSGTKPDAAHVIGVVAPLVVAAWALAFAVRRRWVAYVSDTGAAVYSTRGTRHDVTGQAVRFKDVADVQVVVTGRRKQWVDWRATFTGPDGSVLMTFRGNVRRVGGKPLFNTAHAFAVASHNAWERQAAGSGANAVASSGR